MKIMKPLVELKDCLCLPEDIVLDERAMCDLELLVTGAVHPLKGYLDLNDYIGCLTNMRLVDGTLWTIPMVLPVPLSQVNRIDQPSPKKQWLKLRNKTNALIAEVEVTSIYIPNLEFEKSSMFGKDHDSHPYAKHINANLKDHVYVGGSIELKHSVVHFDFREYRLSPSTVKRRLEERNWKTVVGFQTRNPMHRSHYELTVQALKEVANMTGSKSHLMITPAVGPTQEEDIDYRVRVRCYENILNHYEEEPFLVLIPLSMRMAGPREAVWHATIRKNYGCTHFIVGRDHAGPSAKRSNGSPFYGPYDAHELLKTHQEELGIVPVFGRNLVYAGEDLGYVEYDKLPEGAISQSLSGTEFRRLLMNREPVPEWFCFDDVSRELAVQFAPFHERGLCVYFTGLPCSGKSTLASALEAVLLGSRSEKRKVTVLDADIIRTHLSKGLGFSKGDRSLNVRRIGYVASEIVKHGGICLVANIAPYEEDRQYNRSMIKTAGGHYMEVHVSTPLEVCEQRDIKELYKKARSGLIKQFTGVSDPYEIPSNPELTINSSEDAAGTVMAIYEHMVGQNYCLDKQA